MTYSAIDCISVVKIALINGVPIVGSESESAISSNITLVIKEFNVILPAIAAIVLVVTKTLRKHAIALVSGASLFNLPRYRVNPTEHVELKRQVNLKLSSAEVVKNTSVNRTIDESRHDEIAYGLGTRQPTYLIP